MKWISVDEKLPDKEGNYLVVMEWIQCDVNSPPKIERGVESCWFTPEYEILIDSDEEFHRKRTGKLAFQTCNTVTHWAELPAMPAQSTPERSKPESM